MTLIRSVFFVLTTICFHAATCAEYQYYFGETKVTSGSGVPMATMLSLVKLTFNKEENKIIEQVANIKSNEPTKENTIVFVVKDNKFTFSDPDKSYSGSGELLGEAWPWKGWRYSLTWANNKGKLEGEETFGANALNSKKTMTDEEGRPRMRFTEELLRISEQSYELLRKKFITP